MGDSHIVAARSIVDVLRALLIDVHAQQSLSQALAAATTVPPCVAEAIGMLAERHGVGVGEAARLLQRRAFEEGKAVDKIAAVIVASSGAAAVPSPRTGGLTHFSARHRRTETW